MTMENLLTSKQAALLGLHKAVFLTVAKSGEYAKRVGKILADHGGLLPKRGDWMKTLQVLIGLIVAFLCFTLFHVYQQMNRLSGELKELKTEYQKVWEVFDQAIRFQEHIQSRTDHATDISYAIVFSARRHRLDPNLLAALIEAESSFNHLAVSRAGCLGLAQLSPDKLKNWKDIYQNVETGSRYLAGLNKRFRGDMDQALAGYNSGPNNRRKMTISHGYIRQVHRFQKRWSSPQFRNITGKRQK